MVDADGFFEVKKGGKRESVGNLIKAVNSS